eukprot:CAMPEP_0118971670 /NCGR_PEP_ID=MMETSP1173-20130426/8218_1 /TAXON_ID=1034831 /ORGANISM="Rhizochromulina marina cf, Strain CCMP1243" /LENGTH=395 /DNA_ID=CAMNT_0006921147 /DNA_START=205 /DNA_END=1392 /DNA_ORIENTATION=-
MAATTEATLPTKHAPNLLTPTSLGQLQLKNRVVMAPLTRGRAAAGTRVPTERMVQYYEQRAANTGMIIIEATTVSEAANGWVQSPGMYTEEHAQGWKLVVDAVHAKGTPIVYQMWHLGRASHTSFHGGAAIVAPSALKIEGDGVYAADNTKQPHEVPRALETSEVEALVADYVNSAKLALAVGFDAVEVHSANGYLLDTFLQSSTNKREDKYGGSLENRMRLLNEILDGLSAVFPADRIGVRFSPNGSYNGMGSEDNIETFTYALQDLAPRGLAYVHIMDGLGFGFHEKCRAFTIEDAREVYPDGKLMCNVGYTRESGDAVVAAGTADAVAYGRPFLGNPDLVYRFAHDLPLAESNPATWFTHDDDGYADYPTYEEEQQTKKAQVDADGSASQAK